MTPQERFDYKMKWMPGIEVPVHTDCETRAISWCKYNIENHEWTRKRYTDVYECTFHFENEATALIFKKEMGVR